MLRDMVECAPHEFTVAECSALTLAIAALSEQGEAVPARWMVGDEIFASESEAVEAIMQWGPSGSIAVPLYATPPAQVGDRSVAALPDQLVADSSKYPGDVGLMMKTIARELMLRIQAAQAEPPTPLTPSGAPIGTKAPAIGGGAWVKVANGWQWPGGSTFPQPGGDWTGELIEPPQDVGRLVDALRKAEAALADIGDADREPGDDLAWCERRAAEALPVVRAALAAHKGEEG